MAPEIKFSDGVEFDMQGSYRIETRFDGLYVVLVDALADRNDGEKVTDADREALAVVLADRHRD